jgi:UDP-N-acetylglucosamine pyrophosphorylase
MEAKSIDVGLTTQILDSINAGKHDNVKPVEVSQVPEIDGNTILDMTQAPSLTMPTSDAEARLNELVPGLKPDRFGTVRGDRIEFDAAALRAIGLRLYPLVSYGVLNGGSATSYADTKKNSSFDETLFEIVKPDFERLAEMASGRAKGITPAFLQPNGEPGPSFLELKMRSLLVEALRYYRLPTDERPADGPGAGPAPLFPMFQMTSVYNDEEIAETYEQYRESPLLKELIGATGIDITQVETGVQPMIAALTHSELGRPKDIFQHAYGQPGETLPLPGGHGQNFQILRDVYKRLHDMGKRFVYLGNVDNLGFTVEPVSLAYLALTGKQAGFDFAFRTPVDVKGGVLVEDTDGHLNSADIGPAISKEEAFKAEEQGKRILFNCASGLFNLDYLVSELDRIIDELPLRISDQDKDAGRYSQAEQVTWEIIGMLDDFLVFGIDKYDRFLAAKLLSETLMTSGVKLDDARYPTADDPAQDLRGTAEKLHRGLKNKLEQVYAMELQGGAWRPSSSSKIGRG